ncbi:MAG TPA: M20/M25/M40 family metallo-hydrolase [Kofleriaceae bacterium]
MRSLILAASLLASTASAGTFVTIGADAVPTAMATAERDHAALNVVSSDGDVAVLEVDDDELANLSEQMHIQFHRCGGFMTHDSLADALAPAQPPATRLEYSLDHAAAVTSVLSTLDAERLAGTIRELSAMPNRYYKSAAGAEASNWLAERWRSFATRPGVTVQLVDHGFPQKSVVLTIPGTTRADEVIVLGGHLDSIAMAGISSNAPGADDDASGIATLTEIARGLLAADYRPERTIKFIAYEAEEVGLRGSQAIVKDFQRARTNVVGALQLDMTNFKGSDKDIWLMKDFTSAEQNAFLVKLIETYTGATWGLDACGYACSDHASWTKAGVPASMPFESRSKQMNKHIHTGRDTIAQSNNEATHALKFAKLGAAYAIELGKGSLGEGGHDNHGVPWQLFALGMLAVGSLAVARRVVG